MLNTHNTPFSETNVQQTVQFSSRSQFTLGTVARTIELGSVVSSTPTQATSCTPVTVAKSSWHQNLPFVTLVGTSTGNILRVGSLPELMQASQLSEVMGPVNPALSSCKFTALCQPQVTWQTQYCLKLDCCVISHTPHFWALVLGTSCQVERGNYSLITCYLLPSPWMRDLICLWEKEIKVSSQQVYKYSMLCQ